MSCKFETPPKETKKPSFSHVYREHEGSLEILAFVGRDLRMWEDTVDNAVIEKEVTAWFPDHAGSWFFFQREEHKLINFATTQNPNTNSKMEWRPLTAIPSGAMEDGVKWRLEQCQ